MPVRPLTPAGEFLARKLDSLKENKNNEGIRHLLHYSIIADAADIPSERIYKMMHIPKDRSVKKRLSLFYAVKVAIVLQLDESEATEFLHRCGYAIEYDVQPEYPLYREAIALAHAGADIEEIEELFERVQDICQDGKMYNSPCDYVLNLAQSREAYY